MYEVTIKQEIPRDGYSFSESLVGVFDNLSDAGAFLHITSKHFKIDEIVIKPVVTEPVEIPEEEAEE